MTQSENNRLAEAVIDHIKGDLLPEDVFDSKMLAEWAEENGYVLKEGED